MGDLGIGAIVRFAMVSVFVFLPLALWKLVEIIIWLVRHVHVGLS